jgi:RNA polymerase-associated protein RTF1
MEESDDEEEGQVTRYDEEEDRRMATSSKKESEVIDKEDLEKIRLTRDFIEKWCYLSTFESVAKGCYVRYLLGLDEEKKNVYRVCEITGMHCASYKMERHVDACSGLTEELPNKKNWYKISDVLFNQDALLKHGGSTRAFPLDRVSNQPFTDVSASSTMCCFRPLTRNPARV